MIAKLEQIFPAKKGSLGSIVGIVCSQQSSACCSCLVDVVSKADTSVKQLLKTEFFLHKFLTVKNIVLLLNLN